MGAWPLMLRVLNGQELQAVGVEQSNAVRERAINNLQGVGLAGFCMGGACGR